MKIQTAAITVFIADDFEPFRNIFRTMLENLPGIRVIGMAQNGTELLSQIQFNTPDVILCDVRMPGMDGFQATALITKNYPQISVIAFSTQNDDYAIMQMLAAGAKGFILKDTSPGELAQAIKSVYKNESYFCKNTHERLSNLIKAGIYNPQTHEFCIKLTEREKQVLRLICMEMSNSEISDKLSISIRTVEKFRSKMLIKTGASNLAGLVVFAIKYGIYNPELKYN